MRPATIRAAVRKRGNPYWGHALPLGPAVATEFELQVRHLHLTADAYAPQLNCAVGAGRTGIGSTSPNGCWRSGTSP